MKSILQITCLSFSHNIPHSCIKNILFSRKIPKPHFSNISTYCRKNQYISQKYPITLKNPHFLTSHQHVPLSSLIFSNPSKIDIFPKHQPLSQHVLPKYQTLFPGTPANLAHKITENKIFLNRPKHIDHNHRSAIMVLEVEVTRSRKL